MKILILLTLIGMNALAADLSSLDGDMKAIGADFKSIGQAVSDPAKNASSRLAALDMESHFQSALREVPDSINALPAADQPAAVQDYQRLIEDEINHSAALARAFASNDNAGAVAILRVMTSDKTEGHSKFSAPNDDGP